MKYFNISFNEFIALIIAFMAPLFSTMLAIGVLLFLDLILGIWAALSLKEKITSKKMSLSISKMLIYNLTIIACYVTEKFLVPEIPFVKIAAGLIGMVELKSLAENVYKITGLKIWEAIKEFVSRKKQS